MAHGGRSFSSRLGFHHQRGGGQIETEALSNRSKPKRVGNNNLGPTWVLCPEDRSNVETEIPNHAEIESIEPRPTLSSSEGHRRTMCI